MSTVQSVNLRLSAGTTPGWRHFVVLWLSVALLEGVLLVNHAALDSLAWRTTRWCMGNQDAYVWANVRQPPGPEVPFYLSVEPPLHGRLYKRTENIWRLLRDAGEPYFTLLLVAVVALYDRRRWKAPVILLAATTGASLVAEMIRVVAGRLRPDGLLPDSTRNAGESMFCFLGGLTHHTDLSFPSGHATLAFATAAVLTHFSPRGRGLFIAVAAGCALARVVMQAHFYGDVIMGSAVGWTVGWGITASLDKLFCPAN